MIQGWDYYIRSNKLDNFSDINVNKINNFTRNKNFTNIFCLRKIKNEMDNFFQENICFVKTMLIGFDYLSLGLC